MIGAWSSREARKGALRLVRATLARHRGALVSVALVSVVLSVIPTVKSELESAIVDQIDKGLKGGRDDTLGDAFREHVHRLGGDGSGGIDSIVRAVGNVLFDDKPLSRALLVYAGVVVVAYGLTVVGTSLRARVNRSFYTQLRAIGVQKALNFEPVGGPEDATRAGRQAAAIQVGSSNVASGYASWLEAGQQVFVIVTTLVLVAARTSSASATSSLRTSAGPITRAY